MAVTDEPKVPARFEHRSHGRLRVRVPKQRRSAGDLERVKKHLEAHSSVGHVEVNPRSGSILVQGDHTASLDSALREVLDIVEKEGPEGGSEVGVETAVALVKRADAKLGQATNGRLSLRWIVPGAFLTVGVRQLLAEGLSIGALPWYVLVYYGVDSFLKLYPEHAPQAPPKLHVVPNDAS